MPVVASEEGSSQGNLREEWLRLVGFVASVAPLPSAWWWRARERDFERTLRQLGLEVEHVGLEMIAGTLTTTAREDVVGLGWISIVVVDKATEGEVGGESALGHCTSFVGVDKATGGDWLDGETMPGSVEVNMRKLC